MYFASRLQAGRTLAKKLVEQYRYENCAVVALNDGGVIVGAQIAAQLHCLLTLMVTEEIKLPREPLAVGAVTEDGTFTLNPAYSPGEMEEILSEYRQYIEQQKMESVHRINQLLSHGTLLDRSMLKGRTIILVADGLQDAFQLDLAMGFLKPIQIEKLVIVTAMASVKAIDKMHIIADQIDCLNVFEGPFDTNHYFEKQDVPDHKKIIDTIEQIILQWK